MTENKQVRLSGFGGQGIILAGTILSYASINDGKWVACSNSYGAAARGGSCKSEVVISDNQIVYPLVLEADIFITMSQSTYNQYKDNVNDNGLIIYDKQLVTPGELNTIRQIGVSATTSALENFNNQQAANIIILAATTEITKIVSKTALIAAIEQTVASKFKELNLKAANIGFELGEKEI